MKKLLTAVVIATAAMAGAASAQEDEMGQGLSMLETAVANEFAKMGIDADPMSLTLNQLAQVQSIVSNSDSNVNDMKLQVEKILSE